MGSAKIYILPSRYFMSFKSLLNYTVGSQLVKKWKSIEKEDIVSIEDSILPDVLRIQEEGFKNINPEIMVKYSKNFRDIFFVIKSKGKIVGYCIYYLKPSISLRGFAKQSVISSIATDSNFRGKGFAEKLLRNSIEEMKVNGISSVLLYVNVNNLPAIKLYKKIGFKETKEVENICGQNEKCYEMKLRLF